MKLSDVMTYGARTVGGGDTLRQAAQLMAELDVGSLPVCDGDKLVGIITDRDIALRAIGEGRGPDVTVGEIMSHDVKSCQEEDDLAHVSALMAQAQIRRLPVVDRDHRLVGVVALGDLARQDNPKRTGATLGEISEPAVKM
jgi:CBS domain-containing protein